MSSPSNSTSQSIVTHNKLLPNLASPVKESKFIQQIFPTTIPSHPSTIQYIPVVPTTTVGNTQQVANLLTTSNQPNQIRFHIISTAAPKAESTAKSSDNTSATIHYQYIATSSSGNFNSNNANPTQTLQGVEKSNSSNTIHYQPNNIKIVPSSILIPSNNVAQQTNSNVNNASTDVKTSNESSQSRNIFHIITSNSSLKAQNPSNILQTSLAVTNNSSSDFSVLKTVNNNMTANQDTPDQQIRVLTPSEIMKTLPSLGQESYDPSPPNMVSHSASHVSKHILFWFFIYL